MAATNSWLPADIFRGRYRESFETPKALAPDKPLLYRFALPTANHVFPPGHRVLVQNSVELVPLYDRNPQTSFPAFFGPSPPTIAKPPSASTTHRARPLLLNCRLSLRLEVFVLGNRCAPPRPRDSSAPSLLF